MSPDERFVQDLYNRAVLNVYEPWTRRGVSWVSRAEARRAAHVVSIARQNLVMLAEAEDRAETPRVVHWNWQRRHDHRPPVGTVRDRASLAHGYGVAAMTNPQADVRVVNACPNGHKCDARSCILDGAVEIMMPDEGRLHRCRGH